MISHAHILVTLAGPPPGEEHNTQTILPGRINPTHYRLSVVGKNFYDELADEHSHLKRFARLQFNRT